MILTQAGRPVSASIRLVPVALLLAVLAWQLWGYGPTPDPDPDGYVSYAQGLLETGQLQSHRRLPGYPALIALVDTLAPGAINIDMFWLHAGLILIVALISTFLVQRHFGYWTSLIYLAILAAGSYFARAMIFMLADLPSMIFFYGVIAAGLGFITGRGAARWICLGCATVAMILNFAVHSASAMLFQILIWITVGLLLLHVARRGGRPQTGPFSAQATRSTIASLLVLSVLAYGAQASVKTLLQLPHDQRFIEHPVPSPDEPDAVTNSETFYRSWLAYRLLLCLPPSSQAEPFDMEIEEAKSAIENRLGYPTDAVVPPAFAPEFLALIRSVDIPLATSYTRLSEHPLALVGCAFSEMRAKWYFLVRNLTPFTPFDADKTWITPAYPPVSDSAAETIFWKTGIYLADTFGTNQPYAAILPQFLLEIARSVLVLTLVVGGLILLDRRWNLVGLIAGLSLLAWFALLSVALPVETRYFLPFFPLLYLSQAVAISRMMAVSWDKLRSSFPT